MMQLDGRFSRELRRRNRREKTRDRPSGYHVAEAGKYDARAKHRCDGLHLTANRWLQGREQVAVPGWGR